MIVRLLNEGQYELPEDQFERLNALDRDAAEALERNDETALQQVLQGMADLVREGRALDDGDLSTSHAVVPPADLTLAEARKLMSAEGLIPDLAPNGSIR